MKRVITLVLAISFLAAWRTQVVHATIPDGLPYETPIVTISSPADDGIYNATDVPLNVTVQIFGFIYHNIERIRWLNYSLDAQTAIPMSLNQPDDLYPGYYVHGNDVLTGLSEGEHNLTIYCETTISGLSESFNATASFRVDTSTPPYTKPFPTALVAVSSGVLASAIGTVIFYKKRKAS